MATMVVEPVFVDTNILIYAQQALSPFNTLATAKLNALTSVGHPLWVSRRILWYLRNYPTTAGTPFA